MSSKIFILGLVPIDVHVRWEPSVPDDKELARNPLANKYPNGGRSMLTRVPTPEDRLQPQQFVPGSAAEYTKFLSDFEVEFPQKKEAFSKFHLGWQLFNQRMPRTDDVYEYLQLHQFEYKVLNF